MKRCLICLFLSFSFLGLSTNVRAEDEGEQKVRKALDEVFSELDKTKIPTGFLEEYAVDYISIENYDGNQKDTTLIDIDIMTYLMKGIRSAAVGEKPFGDVDEIIAKYRNDKPVSERTETYVLFNAYKYNYIPDSAVSEGKIQVVNNKLKDVYKNGSWVNPYAERQLIAFSPIEHTVPMGVDFTFKFPESKWWSNQTIRYTQVDFGDGKGVRGLTPNLPATAHYTTPGRKKLHMTVWFNGWTAGINSYVDVIDPNEDANIPTKGDVGTVQYGDFSKEFSQRDSPRSPVQSAIVTINYAPSHNNTLQKPLIVVEGFEPTILFPTYESEVEKIYGSSNLESFLRKSGPNFNYFKENYDIVYVDWNNPEIGIDRNASLLKSIIKWVNSQKVTEEKNILIAESMGGLIAQFAIYSMERREQKHQIRMFVSCDVPYFGVNVPLGLQSFVHSFFDYATYFGLVTQSSLASDWYRGKSNILSYLYEILYDSGMSVPEMMMQAVKKDGTIVDNRAVMEKNFKTRGLPNGDAGSPIVNIGFSNGTRFGSYPILDNGNLLSINGVLEPKCWVSLLVSLFYDFTGPIKTLTDNNRWIKLLLGLPGKSRLHLDAYAKASTVTGMQKISSIDIVYRKKLLGFIPVEVPIYSSSCTHNVKDAYDTYYGSGYSLKPFKSLSPYLNSDGNSLDLGKAANEKWGRYEISGSLVSGCMFVPTASALAVGGGSRSLTQSDFQNYAYYNGNYKDSPFDHYMCSSASNLHTGFDDGLYELMKNNLVVISGPQVPVTGDKYEAKGLDGTTEIRWSSSKPWMTIDAEGMVTIDKEKADGVVEITASWYEGQNVYTQSKKVVAGIPDFSLEIGRIGNNHGTWIEAETSDSEFMELAKNAGLQYFWRRKEGESGQITSLGVTDSNRQIYYDPEAKGDAWYYVTVFLGEYNTSTYSIKVPYYKTIIGSYSYIATLDSDGEIFLSADSNQELPGVEEKLMQCEAFINGVADFKQKEDRLAIIPVELSIDGFEITVPVKIVKSDVLKSIVK